MEHWVQEAPADFGFHSVVWGLTKASGMMLMPIRGCLTGAELQPVSLV